MENESDSPVGLLAEPILDLSGLQLLTHADFTFPGDMLVRLSLLGDDNGRALVISVLMESGTFELRWHTCKPSDVTEVSQWIRKGIEAAYASVPESMDRLGRSGEIARLHHVVTTAQNMAWRIDFHNRRVADA